MTWPLVLTFQFDNCPLRLFHPFIISSLSLGLGTTVVEWDGSLLRIANNPPTTINIKRVRTFQTHLPILTESHKQKTQCVPFGWGGIFLFSRVYIVQKGISIFLNSENSVEMLMIPTSLRGVQSRNTYRCKVPSSKPHSSICNRQFPSNYVALAI